MSKRVSKRVSRKLLILIALLSVTFNRGVKAQNTGIDNGRILTMARLGLDDEIIVAKIKSSKCSFEVTDDDLLKLAKAGISPKVQAAMVEASKIKITRVVIDKKSVDLHLFIQFHMTQQFLSLSKARASLPGKHSSVIVGTNPEIVLELPKDLPTSDAVNNYILVQLDGKENHRELPLVTSIMGGVTGYASPKGEVSKEAIRASKTTLIADGKLKITPAAPLKPGEYLIFVVDSYNWTNGVFAKGYDFTVE